MSLNESAAGKRANEAQPVVRVGKVSLEVQVFEGEVSLHDARCFDSGPQDVLLGWDVVCLGYPVQIVQIAEERADGEKQVFIIHTPQKTMKAKRLGNAGVSSYFRSERAADTGSNQCQ